MPKKHSNSITKVQPNNSNISTPSRPISSSMQQQDGTATATGLSSSISLFPAITSAAGAPSTAPSAVAASSEDTMQEIDSKTRKRAKSCSSSLFGGGEPNKRRSTGILTSAIGWARSQAKELDEFEAQQKLEGTPHKPLPPLPVRTRKIAALHHDMMKAQRKGKGRIPASAFKNVDLSTYLSFPHPDILNPQNFADQICNNNPLLLPLNSSQGTAGRAVHPVTLAFMSNTDSQMTDVLGKGLSRLDKSTTSTPEAPNQYMMSTEECKQWAIGNSPTAHDLTAADIEYAAKKQASKHDNNGQQPGMNIIYPQPSKYFLQPSGHQFFSTSNGNRHQARYRYPRRSSRARNAKRDDMYIPLESDEDTDEGNEAEHIGDDGGDTEDDSRKLSADRRGPGRPRKLSGKQMRRPQLAPNLNLSSHGYAHHVLSTPPTNLLTLPGKTPDILSPFALFLLDQQRHLAAANAQQQAPGSTDPVDYASLDDFISSLNFTNDALIAGSPQAFAAAVAASTVGQSRGDGANELPLPPPLHLGTIPEDMSDKAGGVPITNSNVDTSIKEVVAALTTSPRLRMKEQQQKSSPSQQQPIASITTINTTTPSAPMNSHTKGDTSAIHTTANTSILKPASTECVPLLAPILDSIACKPLETPTVAGMLSIELNKKTPLLSPSFTNPSGISPTLLSLNF